mgnify:FL=1|jgi:hypothetical protein
MPYALAMRGGSVVKLARGLTISLDFDKTWTADPQLWRDFVGLARKAGHRVVLITRRPDTETDRATVEKATASSGIDRLIFAGQTQKADAARKAGVSVDVWVDDYPAGIPS